MSEATKKAEEVFHDLQKKARKVLAVGEIAVQTAKMQWVVLKKQIPVLATKSDIKNVSEQLKNLNQKVAELTKKLNLRKRPQPQKDQSRPHQNT